MAQAPISSVNFNTVTPQQLAGMGLTPQQLQALVPPAHLYDLLQADPQWAATLAPQPMSGGSQPGMVAPASQGPSGLVGLGAPPNPAMTTAAASTPVAQTNVGVTAPAGGSPNLTLGGTTGGQTNQSAPGFQLPPGIPLAQWNAMSPAQQYQALTGAGLGTGIPQGASGLLSLGAS